jgi:hypothetical protein
MICCKTERMATSWVVRTKFAVRGSAVDLHEDISSSVVVSERIATCLEWGLTNMSSEIILSNTGNDPQDEMVMTDASGT